MHTPKQQLERSAFLQHPLGDLNPTKRGLIVQHIVWKIDESHHNIATSSESGISHFDWLWKDLHIECKHTRIAWCSSHHSWVCRFSGVKMDRFDLLYLWTHLGFMSEKNPWLQIFDQHLDVYGCGRNAMEKTSELWVPEMRRAGQLPLMKSRRN